MPFLMLLGHILWFFFCYKNRTRLIINERSEPSPDDYFRLKVRKHQYSSTHVSVQNGVRKVFVSRVFKYTAISIVILIYYFVRTNCKYYQG